jgi:hypothetical protein
MIICVVLEGKVEAHSQQIVNQSRLLGYNSTSKTCCSIQNGIGNCISFLFLFVLCCMACMLVLLNYVKHLQVRRTWCREVRSNTYIFSKIRAQSNQINFLIFTCSLHNLEIFLFVPFPSHMSKAYLSSLYC